MHPKFVYKSLFKPQKVSRCKIDKPLAQRRRIVVKRHKPEKEFYNCVSVVDDRRKVSRDAPKNLIIDIDREDVNNPLAGVEYVQDLYNFYKLAESSSQVGDYMCLQREIDASMRMILVDLLVSAHDRLRLSPEALYLAVHIVDRYLEMNHVTRNEFQLVGLSSLVIATKYEEDFVPPVEAYVTIADGAFSKQQIFAMEKSILGKLGWTLTIPTTYHFLVRFIKAAIADKEMENTAFFFAELGLMQYGMIKYSPSLLAASAVYAANCTLEKTSLWNETLRHYTGYSECQLIECAKQLSRFHSKVAGHELRATFRKYLSCKRYVVSLLPPAPSLCF